MKGKGQGRQLAEQFVLSCLFSSAVHNVAHLKNESRNVFHSVEPSFQILCHDFTLYQGKLRMEFIFCSIKVLHWTKLGKWLSKPAGYFLNTLLFGPADKNYSLSYEKQCWVKQNNKLGDMSLLCGITIGVCFTSTCQEDWICIYLEPAHCVIRDIGNPCNSVYLFVPDPTRTWLISLAWFYILFILPNKTRGTVILYL